MGLDLVAYLVIALVVLGIVASAIRIMREYERAVVFTLGRYSGVRGPGIIFVIPFLQQAVKVDMRTITMDVPSQDVISKDNVSVKVNAVIYFRVVDADRSIIQVEDYMMATSQLAQTTLRSVLGKHDLDEMLSERDKLNSDIQEILDSQTDAWGIKVANVEIKHVDIDESMVRAIARQAEAERNRRARIIDAEGEMQASQKLSEAADILSQTPEAMQLRFLSTLYDIAGDKNSTIVFPVPIDLLRGFMGGGGGDGARAAREGEWQKPAG
ncbi:MAG: slipin family protein [Salinarimonas sp.]